MQAAWAHLKGDPGELAAPLSFSTISDTVTRGVRY
jgi:hypothetical protein